MMVYLLDDEPDMLSLLADIVRELDIEPQCFSKAKQLFGQIAVFEAHSVMVLDLHMPEMDGIEVMRKLATINNPPALILISGHDAGVLHSAEKLGKAQNLNILASLDKPIPLEKFKNLLKAHFNQIGQSAASTLVHGTSDRNPQELLYALENNQMLLHYQPQIEVKNGKLTGCEALIRWQHPTLGLIYPDQFIPLAEHHGWMGLLTNWVISQAVEQEQIWKDLGYHLPISVNISADNITTLSLPEQMSELLTDKKLNPTMLTLEVTESALMGELVTSLDILTRLRLKGIGLSIDDFGTGYSSLSQLHKIPFSELKIDRSFVAAMLEDEEACAIVKTCIMLGHELNMQVVAEGVESQQHADLLKQLGCDTAQGYLYSKPLPALDLTRMMQADRQWSSHITTGTQSSSD